MYFIWDCLKFTVYVNLKGEFSWTTPATIEVISVGFSWKQLTWCTAPPDRTLIGGEQEVGAAWQCQSSLSEVAIFCIARRWTRRSSKWWKSSLIGWGGLGLYLLLEKFMETVPQVHPGWSLRQGQGQIGELPVKLNFVIDLFNFINFTCKWPTPLYSWGK